LATALTQTTGPVTALIDSTGLKVFGAGERPVATSWCITILAAIRRPHPTTSSRDKFGLDLATFNNK
jgi:hypothetical protein